MSTEMTIVEFDGDELLATQDGGGTVWVSGKRVCEALGVAWQRQLNKLRDASWSTITLKVTVAEDGKNRDTICVDRRTLLMWLATITPGRVSEDIRPKLERYQNQVADVLDIAFCGEPIAEKSVLDYRPDELEAISSKMRRHDQLRKELAEIDEQFHELRQTGNASHILPVKRSRLQEMRNRN